MLKKQSQFVQKQIVTNAYLKGCYDQFCNFEQRKNKAKQSQFAYTESGRAEAGR
jgi:hypothetical protein